MLKLILQYNSCYCLSLKGLEYLQENSNFNTTLVIVYLIKFVKLFLFLLLQYNSCYCLSHSLGFRSRSWSKTSIQLLLLFISRAFFMSMKQEYFNTTLVIVYRHQSHQLPTLLRLQYNSCYCLSNAFKPFLFFIIASFPDKINVSFVFSQLICFFVFPSLN